MANTIVFGYQPANMRYPNIAASQSLQPTQSPQNGEDSTATGTSAKGKGSSGSGIKDLSEKYRCKTCESRTYMDGSNDPGVSMKTPTKVSPMAAASAVMNHEQQHVARNAFKAQAEGRVVVSSSVTIHSGVCSECGKTYVAGGTTRTVTAAKNSGQQAQQQVQNRKKLDMKI